MKLITLDNLNHFKEKLEKLNATKEELITLEETLKSSVFDLIYPIGVTYVQYPQCKSPMELWGSFSTWQVVNYDGAFFRAEGTNANAFIEKTGVLVAQPEGLPNITGSFHGTAHCKNDGSITQSYSGGGAISDSLGVHINHRMPDNYNHAVDVLYSLNASKSNSIYGASSHVTPKNYTMRIWKRIS